MTCGIIINLSKIRAIFLLSPIFAESFSGSFLAFFSGAVLGLLIRRLITRIKKSRWRNHSLGNGLSRSGRENVWVLRGRVGLAGNCERDLQPGRAKIDFRGKKNLPSLQDLIKIFPLLDRIQLKLFKKLFIHSFIRSVVRISLFLSFNTKSMLKHISRYI